jgi:hypothetical protein
VHIEPGATELVIPADDTTEYYATLMGAKLRFGRSEVEARSDTGREGYPGDRGPMKTERNESLYAHNPSETETAKLQLDHNGWWWTREARAVVASVFTSDENEAAPASDDFVWEHGSEVDIFADTEEIPVNAPDRADKVKIHVDAESAEGPFDVELHTLDGPGGSVLTTRDKTDNSDYGSDGTTDVFVVAEIAAPYLRVDIIDASGASNTVTYSVYAR